MCDMQRIALVLCVAATALAVASPQYRGAGAVRQASPGRYRNLQPGEDTQQESRQISGQRSQPALPPNRNRQQYSQDSAQAQQYSSSTARKAPVAGTSGAQQNRAGQNKPAQQYRAGGQSKRAPPVPIVRYQNSPTGDGGNQHAYETGNGIEREEGVFIKELTVTDEDGKQKTVKVPVYRGSFKYQQPDGSFVEVQYEADETGFHAIGDSIPQALQ